jgi:cytochrome P450
MDQESTTSWSKSWSDRPLTYGVVGIILVRVFLGFIQIILTRHWPGLRSIPGPFLASISDLDRIWSCLAGQQMNYHLKLHEKYGPLVRVGPKHVSFSDGSLIPTVYGINTRFWKSEFYDMFHLDGTTTTFSERDELVHRAKRRPVSAAYSMSTMKELEPMNDECSAILCDKLGGLVGQEIDLGDWLHWYAFDVVTTIAFSNRLGFMESQGDVQGVIQALSTRLKYNTVIGQAPYLHRYLAGSRIFGYLTSGNSVVGWAISLFRDAKSLDPRRYLIEFITQQTRRRESKDPDTMQFKDLLGRFKRFGGDGEKVMDDKELVSHAAANILAGSDTTASTLRALFYHLCRTPAAHKKLLGEIDKAQGAGLLSDPVTFEEAQRLRYFQAVVKEALRMHPAIGLLLERVVPRGGADVGGVWLPGGTVIGMNPWVAARDRSVYGDDAYTFRPERWLEADSEQLKLMERNFLAVRKSPSFLHNIFKFAYYCTPSCLIHEISLKLG